MSAPGSSVATSTTSSKKHKNKANGFLMFLLEYKRNNKVEMMEAQNKAGKLWETMNEGQRSTYIKRAEQSTAQASSKSSVGGGSSSTVPLKFNTFGESIADLEAQDAARKTGRKTMKQDIGQMTMVNSLKELKNRKFFFISASHYYRESNSSKAYPAELAIVKYSLADGIEDEFHVKIYPGELPLGSASVANEHAEKTHGYNLPPTPRDGNGDYHQIFEQISNFFGVQLGQKRPQYPAMFVHPSHDSMATVKAVMDTITVEVKENLIFRIYPIEDLLFSLVNRFNDFQRCDDEDHEVFKSPHQAREFFITKDHYSFMPIGCEFHNKCDRGEYCSLAMVRRCAGMVSKKILLKREIVEGKHTPIGIDYAESDTEDVISVSSHQSSDDFSVVKMMMSRMSMTSLSSMSVTSDSGDETDTSEKPMSEILHISRTDRPPPALKTGK